MPVRKKNFRVIALVILLGGILLVSTGLIEAEDKSFTGEVVQIEAQTIAPGEAELIVSLELSPGYELMRDVPILAKITSGEKNVVALGGESATTCRQPKFPLRVPLKAQPGKTQLHVDLVLYYCKTKGGGLCITKQARLILPVQVEPAAKAKQLQASYKVPAV